MGVGREGNVGNVCINFCAHGVSFQVDVRRMEQQDVSTGQTVKVQRSKHGSWFVKKSSQKSGGWMPYPTDLSQRLEEVYMSIVPLEEAPAKLVSPSLANDAEEGAEELVCAVAEREKSLAMGEMGQLEVSEALHLVFEKVAEQGRCFQAAARLIVQLSQRQGLRCGPEEARRAGLVIGSMMLLQAILATNPAMQLFGFEVFDQKYTGIKLNQTGRKNGIRSLLARGMCLGGYTPSSKLLKKIEADSSPLWQSRFCEALQQSFLFLPDPVMLRIRGFMFGDL